MSHQFKLLALSVGLSFSMNSVADENAGSQKTEENIKIIEPEKTLTPAQSAAIDTERFELGLFTGALAVENFNSNLVSGLSFNYHISRRMLAQVNYGQSEVDQATFEENSDGNFLAQDDYEFKYYNVLAGFKLLEGRSFLGENYKLNSDIYLLGGVGNVSFAGDDNTSLIIGASYRVVATDWLTLNLDFRDHIFERDFLSDEKITQNTEFTVGINGLF